MPKRILQGTVTSTANAQTVTVQVVRRFKHPVLQKTIKKSKKYRAHDEAQVFNVGQQVFIRECAPKSKTKRWEVMTEEMLEQHNQQRAEAAKLQQEVEAQRHAEKEAAN
ncbi:hypothetical protein GCM10011415_42520 [Salipiger pallidus]|uniref:Small ribosomal subunit protein uS17 n=1 Tax=Salipiger pallidus TaxID=1775170 RepID=A0A8J2ZNT3_9RHOB|nr:30S ribosomal protein S17 [Salipiger pallidus]GGG87446.1 hypothetical protein GCM10011415_42520 [Salipiger pallidus]